MRQEVSFGKLKLTNNKGAANNVGQVRVRLPRRAAPCPRVPPTSLCPPR